MNYKKIFKRYPVVAAYLFGSRVNGRVGPISDYDFAVQLNSRTSSSKYLDIKLKIISDLVKILKDERVDLVILNEAPLLLRYQILRYGKSIFTHRPAKKSLFVFETIAKYLDWNYFENKFSVALIKKTARKGLNV